MDYGCTRTDLRLTRYETSTLDLPYYILCKAMVGVGGGKAHTGELLNMLGIGESHADSLFDLDHVLQVVVRYPIAVSLLYIFQHNLCRDNAVKTRCAVRGGTHIAV